MKTKTRNPINMLLAIAFILLALVMAMILVRSFNSCIKCQTDVKTSALIIGGLDDEKNK